MTKKEIEPVRKFACRCSTKGKNEIARMRRWAIRELGATKGDLVTSIVYSLNWGYGAKIEGIANDQWSAISSGTYDEKFKTYIQCDDIVDGFVYTYRAYYEKFGKEREW